MAYVWPKCMACLRASVFIFMFQDIMLQKISKKKKTRTVKKTYEAYIQSIQLGLMPVIFLSTGPGFLALSVCCWVMYFV